MLMTTKMETIEFRWFINNEHIINILFIIYNAIQTSIGGAEGNIFILQCCLHCYRWYYAEAWQWRDTRGLQVFNVKRIRAWWTFHTEFTYHLPFYLYRDFFICYFSCWRPLVRSVSASLNLPFICIFWQSTYELCEYISLFFWASYLLYLFVMLALVWEIAGEQGFRESAIVAVQ